jgi:hypothetical protein
MEPTYEQTTASTEPDVLKDSLDVLHDDIEDLKRKVDAIPGRLFSSARRLGDDARLGNADEWLNPGEIDLPVQSLGTLGLVVLGRTRCCATRINRSQECISRDTSFVPYCDRPLQYVKLLNPGEPVMYAFLVLAAVLVTFFIAILAGGALVGLASLGVQALRAVGRTQDVKAQVPLSKPVAAPADLPEAVNAETFVDAELAYATA